MTHIGGLHPPFMQDPFTTPISLQHWAVVVGVGALIILSVKIEKFFLRCRERRRDVAGAQDGSTDTSRGAE